MNNRSFRCITGARRELSLFMTQRIFSTWIFFFVALFRWNLLFVTSKEDCLKKKRRPWNFRNQDRMMSRPSRHQSSFIVSTLVIDSMACEPKLAEIMSLEQVFLCNRIFFLVGLWLDSRWSNFFANHVLLIPKIPILKRMLLHRTESKN